MPVLTLQLESNACASNEWHCSASSNEFVAEWLALLPLNILVNIYIRVKVALANIFPVPSIDHNKKTLKLAFVQYSFDATEHSIELKPHQNAKGSGMPPYRRQKKSTMEKLDSAVRETKSATRAVKKVYQESGGIQNVRSGSELPRNVQQAHYLKKKQEVQSKPTASRNADTLAAIMHQCKETSTGPHAYIRAVQAAPEPVCVLATDQQINDLVRFCTNPDHFSVLTVDPTFNLGPFNVTPMTYENLLVTNKDGKHPLLLGPVLIHQTKTLSPFHLFASTLISLNSKVAEVKAFGSDGEPELIKAFSLAFRNAVQLRCFSHFRQNIKDKLREIGMPQSATKKIIEDIFGRQIGSHFEEGLVDAEDDVTFLAMLNSLEIEWNNLEKGSIQQKSVPSFFSWFKQYKATTVAQTMLRCVRQKANLGSPPCKFTTNHSESINNVIKMEVEWKESQLPQLIEKLNDIHTRQMQNVEMAILKRGEWRLSQKFQHLEQDENKWFTKLTHEGRRRHIKKVMECSVAKNEATQQSNILPLTPEATGITTVALSTLEAIWQKAQKLISSPGHILNAAWSPNPRARLVASSRSQSPHLVTTDDKEPAKYICDGNCPMFQGFGICAHIVAAAHHNRQLQLFVEWYVQTKCTPNLTVISRQGLPQGAGRKGGVPKRKRTKKQTKIESRSKRVNVSDQPASVCPPPSMATAVTYSSSVTTATTSCPPTLSQTMTPSTNPAQQIYSHGGSMYFPQVTPSCTATYTQIQSPPPVYFPAQVRRPPPPLLSIHQSPASCSSWRLPSVNPFPWRPQLPPTVTTYNMQQTNRNPFFVKFLTKQIKVCQGCRKQFHDENTHPPRDVIIARLERRIVSNPSTGAQVLTKESPSHYHPRLCCIHMVCPSFQKTNLVVPQELSLRLTAAHRVYLDDCLKD